jgi:hypothetical protein
MIESLYCPVFIFSESYALDIRGLDGEDEGANGIYPSFVESPGAGNGVCGWNPFYFRKLDNGLIYVLITTRASSRNSDTSIILTLLRIGARDAHDALNKVQVFSKTIAAGRTLSFQDLILLPIVQNVSAMYLITGSTALDGWDASELILNPNLILVFGSHQISEIKPGHMTSLHYSVTHLL